MLLTNTILTREQFSLFTSYINRESYVHEFPKLLIIEPTNACNLECIMCPHTKMTRPIGMMNFTLFKKIIDQCEGHIEFIWLHLMGESLLHKDIFEFIEYASCKGITLGLSTNAIFLSHAVNDRLLHSKLDVLLVSLDSLNEHTYSKIRVRGDFDKVKNNIVNLLYQHKMAQSHVNIALSIIQMRLNEHEIDAYKATWELRSGLNVITKAFDTFAYQVNDLNNLVNIVPSMPDYTCVCTEPWRTLAIGWDGYVVPCCYDYDYKYILGNANKTPLRQIWNSEAMRALRKKQKEARQSEIELCQHCPIPHEDQLQGASLYSKFNPSFVELQTYYNKGNHGFEPPNFQTLWTQKEFEFLVQDRFQDVQFLFCNGDPGRETVEIQVKLFQQQVGQFDISRRTLISLKTPDEFKGRLLRYEFNLNHDWVPKERGINDDVRRLGVRVETIIH